MIQARLSLHASKSGQAQVYPGRQLRIPYTKTVNDRLRPCKFDLGAQPLCSIAYAFKNLHIKYLNKNKQFSYNGKLLDELSDHIIIYINCLLDLFDSDCSQLCNSLLGGCGCEVVVRILPSYTNLFDFFLVPILLKFFY